MLKKKNLVFSQLAKAEPTLDGICSQLSSDVERARQPALKDILLHLQEKLVSTGEREKKRLMVSYTTQTLIITATIDHL